MEGSFGSSIFGSPFLTGKMGHLSLQYHDYRDGKPSIIKPYFRIQMFGLPLNLVTKMQEQYMNVYEF